MDENRELIYPERKEYGRVETVCALVSYIAAYLYVRFVFFTEGGTLYHNLGFLAALLLLTAIPAVLLRGWERKWESIFWLCCLALCSASAFFGLGRVWDTAESILFIHGFYIWWVVSSGDVLLEGMSGHLLPADMLNAAVRIPFGSFFLRIRTLTASLRGGSGDKRSRARETGLIALASILCAVLFIRAAALLSAADSDFGSLVESFVELFRFEPDFETVAQIILSFPVGCWLYGLAGGTLRAERDKLDKQRDGVYALLEKSRKLPVSFWEIVTGLFTLLYLAFFFVQGKYLFGAFTRTLPEGFIVSEYARQGFFELCRVIAVNFSLLWLVTRTAAIGSGTKRLQYISAALLGESMLLSVTAFSKLALYISCFGFTPLRVQSTWLICLLFAGCVLWTVNIFTGKRLFRPWMLFGAGSLVVTMFI